MTRRAVGELQLALSVFVIACTPARFERSRPCLTAPMYALRQSEVSTATMALATDVLEHERECVVGPLRDACFARGIPTFPTGSDPRRSSDVCWLVSLADGSWCARSDVESALRDCTIRDLDQLTLWTLSCSRLAEVLPPWVEAGEVLALQAPTQRAEMARHLTLMFAGHGIEPSATDARLLHEARARVPPTYAEARWQNLVLTCQGRGNPLVGRPVGGVSPDLPEGTVRRGGPATGPAGPPATPMRIP